jgi:DNA repair exonuclease SbcCD ATPase subunit
MLKIGRVYLDACGYRDGVFEELCVKPFNQAGDAVHHVIHAPNGVGKTTILALLFSTFEPDRRKFLRTEINRQHKMEHYFLPGRLGVVAIELIKDGANKRSIRHVIGQVFWPSPASKGDDGEPGQRRFFAFEAGKDVAFEDLPFRGLSAQPPLRSLEDFVRWAREMRTGHPGVFFNTDSLAHWRKYLVTELGLDLRVIEVQRRFCAAEGGIGAAFLDFRTEQQFLEKIFSFMIPAEAAESVVQALETGLTKIRDLPQRKDQLKALTQLAATLDPFFKAAAELESAEAEHSDDLKRLGRLYSRLKTEIAKLEASRATIEGELILTEQNLLDVRARERKLDGEVLFLDKTAADRRIEDAKVVFERAKIQRDKGDRKRRAAHAAAVVRQLTSAERTRDDLEAELERIERDLAPDRARLERVGANVHALLDRLADEAERDAGSQEVAATNALAEAKTHENAEREALDRKHKLTAELEQLNRRIEDHARDRKQLEKVGALHPNEAAGPASARIAGTVAEQDDILANIDLLDEQLQTEIASIENVRGAAEAEAEAAKTECGRLAGLIAAGRAIETRVSEHELLAVVLAGDTKDPYRLDLLERVRAAKAAREEIFRQMIVEQKSIDGELAFLDAEGVSSVPDDVSRVVQALTESGFRGAQPAEHYLATFKPDSEAAMALVRQDPARFTGVFVADADPKKLGDMAAENRLKLKGPVVVSSATLDLDASAVVAPGTIFGPFSSARFNKLAAAEEKTRLTAALVQKTTEVNDTRAQLDSFQSLIEDLRHLQDSYGERRPDDLARERDATEARQIAATHRAEAATARGRAIAGERTQLKSNRAQVTTLLAKLRSWKQEIDGFALRYVDVPAATARVPIAMAERSQRETEMKAENASMDTFRAIASDCGRAAASLRANAASRRSDKRHYPETDGKPGDLVGTLDDLVQEYKTAEQVLTSKRDAQETHIAQRLTDTRQKVTDLKTRHDAVMRDLVASDLEPFADVVDLDRAIDEAEAAFQQLRDAVVIADGAVNVANAKSGPVVKKIDEAKDRRGVVPISVSGFANETVEASETERDAREILRQAAEKQARSLAGTQSTLESRHAEVKGSLVNMNGLLARTEDHLPEAHRSELPDLSFDVEKLGQVLGQLVGQLAQLSAKTNRLRETAEKCFENVRVLVAADAFRRLEPQVSEHLAAYTARSAGAARIMLNTRVVERIAVVQTEIENQQRDQKACLEQLRQHVIHADDLLRRAMRCSKVPDSVPGYGGERILKIKRMLRDVSPDIVLHQLNLWLDEQALSGRIPKDGAVLAAELLSRIQGGRTLDIEILKPKRDAIQPYMRVDRMGLSGGEGVTVAMMLYTVIQKMAMDERAEDKNAASGGFLMLDNTYGMSNMMEHIVLQMTMADVLGIQLFVTTCSEDKHVLNMFPTITRLVQAEQVLSNGIPQYNRVRSGDYVFKESGHAA